MNYSELTEDAKRHAVAIFLANIHSGYVYHSLDHTESVVKHVTEIARHYHLNEQDLFILTAAAWFHDAGYFNGGHQEHEMRGAERAETFLKENQVPDEGVITSVRNCILATTLPQNPRNLLEQILCDADLFHLGTDEFSENNKRLHKEVETIERKEIGKKEWRRNTILMLESHHYFTDYCRSLLSEKKQRNLEKLLKKESDNKSDHHDKESQVPPTDHIEESVLKENNMLVQHKEQVKKSEHKDNIEDPPGSIKEHIAKVENKEKSDSPTTIQVQKNSTNQAEKLKNKKKPTRGIDTVFRITSNNNQRLSSQADSKAHIMIQVNSIIVSVLISMLFPKIEEYRYLVIPAIMLLSVNVTTIIYSVLATRPQVPGGVFSKQDIDEKKVNLLFFGNFYKMSLEDYSSGMLALMDDSDFLYMSLIRDVYFQGKVLGRKYHLLRISYNVFMYGLVLSIVGFMVAFIIFSGK